MRGDFYKLNLGMVAMYLRDVEDADRAGDHVRRSMYIWQAVGFAAMAGLSVGVAFNQAGLPVVFIELPIGQVSWVVPTYPTAWEDCTDDEKYARVHAFETYIDGMKN